MSTSNNPLADLSIDTEERLMSPESIRLLTRTVSEHSIAIEKLSLKFWHTAWWKTLFVPVVVGVFTAVATTFVVTQLLGLIN